MSGPASPDVLIVGAGVIGAATAFQLSQLGVGRIAVLDRAVAGSGMSSRSSALVRMHYTFPPEVDLAVRSDALFDAWPDLVGRPSCVRRTGFVRIVRAWRGRAATAERGDAASARRADRGGRRGGAGDARSWAGHRGRPLRGLGGARRLRRRRHRGG